ncbi:MULTISPECIES: nucleoside triphosphate pyrophosphohydrolase family protein [Oligella]|uniref:MazG nucleotide pyrophosphohydrolase domain n=1 Tax=Oligella urethralis TaxID=90245 RepID=A0A2X1VHV8_9BURK|nr:MULTISPECIES: nucleoside triphosphate pyrophosphohydrolase family protein [Oligella]OFV49734.1 hypothetical protein HMPREF3179_03750 [Oligella sp. HMSC09E12]SPY08070.1 MazG nucleotide pyrophosphohydrolase domain [Oligella urethralis]
MSKHLTEYPEIVNRLASPKMRQANHHLIHAAMGLSSEAGEITDQIKAHLFYGKELDLVNLVEEAGDLLFFLTLMLYQLNIDIEQVIEGNKAKLEVRYGSEFNTEGALVRDKAKEMEALKSAVFSEASRE